MGAISNFGVVKGTPVTMKTMIQHIIDEDMNSRDKEEDMYRGDFGNSTINNKPCLTFDKLSTPKQAEKNNQTFIDWVNSNNKKYTIDYAVIQKLGHLAVALEVKVTPAYKSSNGVRLNGRTYKNITELKKSLKHMSSSEKERMLFKDITDAKTWDSVGEVSGTNRLYKTKPVRLPAKYDFIQEYNLYSYGGFCPY